MSNSDLTPEALSTLQDFMEMSSMNMENLDLEGSNVTLNAEGLPTFTFTLDGVTFQVLLKRV